MEARKLCYLFDIRLYIEKYLQWFLIEEKLAELEGAEAAVATSSGMGAISSVFWSMLKAGDHVVAAKTLYGCTFALLNHGLSKFGIEVSFVDARDHKNIENAIKENTKIIYMETPANPNMYLTDIEAVAKIAHSVEGCILVVDNTYCTPFIQRPIELGADIVVHSATKYLNGHGDVIAGFAVGRKELIDQVRLVRIKDCTGSVLGGFEAFLLGRGMKTLAVRMKQHCENAQKVAEFLEQHPASMTHSPYTPEERKLSDIAEGLVRISVGLEDVDDIIADLKEALDNLM